MYANDPIPATITGDARRSCQVLLSVQSGIIDRGQAIETGFSRQQIAHRLRSGAWKRVYPGVYATFTGRLTRTAQLWAAVRWAGEGAVLSHETAAELHGIIDEPHGGGHVHVTVPHRRRPGSTRPVRGIIIHRSVQGRPQPLGPFALPRTGIEDTVLDLAAASLTYDRAYSWIARAVSRQQVTAAQLQAAFDARRRIRWRAWLSEALADAGAGAHSSLERRYLRDVERAHGLPRSQRQARRQLGDRAHFRDSWYAEYGIVVEIDGPAYHQHEQVQRDHDRDNLNLAADDVKTFRFGPVHVTEGACETAAMVAATLRRQGWPGSSRPCRRRGCALSESKPAKRAGRPRDVGNLNPPGGA